MKTYAEVILTLTALMFLIVGIGFSVGVISHLFGLKRFLVGDSVPVFVAGGVIAAALSLIMAALVRAITRKILKS